MKIKNRVKSHEDFQKVIQANKKKCNETFVLYFKENELGYARIGISTSKKLGDAVTRNRIRRQVRVMCMNSFDFSKSMDYCIIVRKKYLQQEFLINQNELTRLILKI